MRRLVLQTRLLLLLLCTAVACGQKKPAKKYSLAQKAWPPWPFSMLASSKDADDKKNNREKRLVSLAPRRTSLLLEFTRASAQVGLRNLQYLGSQLWFHLPPAAAPLLIASVIPNPAPLWQNPYCRMVCWSSLGLALVSWSHYQLQHKRNLTPLPLPDVYRDLNRAILPPFLPEEQQIVMDLDLRTTQNNFTMNWKAGLTAPKPYFSEWKRMRDLRRQERHNAKRLAIMDELLAIQEIKKQQHRRLLPKEQQNKLGYALVTGASRGIGRALAVELARWQFPLILVARDMERLTALAYDLQACYGVKCCVIQADLTQETAPERIYHATKKAGLQVDVLVNNAGFSSQGTSVDLPTTEVDNMIRLNVWGVSKLTHLFGSDMKERRKGRILTVSSVCGSVAGISSVAVYSATKAFEKSLSLSMAKEMERFGVGMTCLLPGAVSDTDFRSRSNSGDALCWKIPFYPKSPSSVADMGVRAMLRGETEVTPGLMNRIFLKVFQPALPQRMHNWVAEIMWNPLRLPFMKPSGAIDEPKPSDTVILRPRKGSPFLKNPPPRVLGIDPIFQLKADPADPEEPTSTLPSAGGGNEQEVIYEYTELKDEVPKGDSSTSLQMEWKP